MKYTTANKIEAKAAYDRLRYLTRKQRMVEIKEISPGRSLNQNAYLHLIITAYALESGYRLDEAKTVYKRDANPDIYVYERKGSKFLRSSTDLSVEEMAKSIDRFILFAAESGIDLPPATDQGWLTAIENKAEQNRRYL